MPRRNDTVTEKSTREVQVKMVTTDTKQMSRKLDLIGWGLFLVWIGIVNWVKFFEIGAALIGVGLIVLGVQTTRKAVGLPLEVFWMVVGVCALGGGLWDIFQPNVPVVSIVLIAFGLALLLSAFAMGRATNK